MIEPKPPLPLTLTKLPGAQATDRRSSGSGDLTSDRSFSRDLAHVKNQPQRRTSDVDQLESTDKADTNEQNSNADASETNADASETKAATRQKVPFDQVVDESGLAEKVTTETAESKDGFLPLAQDLSLDVNTNAKDADLVGQKSIEAGMEQQQTEILTEPTDTLDLDSIGTKAVPDQHTETARLSINSGTVSADSGIQSDTVDSGSTSATDKTLPVSAPVAGAGLPLSETSEQIPDNVPAHHLSNAVQKAAPEAVPAAVSIAAVLQNTRVQNRHVDKTVNLQLDRSEPQTKLAAQIQSVVDVRSVTETPDVLQKALPGLTQRSGQPLVSLPEAEGETSAREIPTPVVPIRQQRDLLEGTKLSVPMELITDTEGGEVSAERSSGATDQPSLIKQADANMHAAKREDVVLQRAELVQKSLSGTTVSPFEPVSTTISQTTENMFAMAGSGIVTAPGLTRAMPESSAIMHTSVNAPVNVSLLADDASSSMASNIRWMSTEGVKNAVVNVSPSGMGPISVQIDIDKEQMTVSIVAVQGSTREALDSMLPRLREQLVAQGHDSVRVDVSDGRSEQSKMGYGKQFAQDGGDSMGSTNQSDGDDINSDLQNTRKTDTETLTAPLSGEYTGFSRPAAGSYDLYV